MRYLVTARVKSGREDALEGAIADGSLGRGSVAGDEYFRNMDAARQLDDGRVQWVEVCYCATPLAEEREVLGTVLRPRKGPGRARAQPLPRFERDGAVGLQRV